MLPLHRSSQAKIPVGASRSPAVPQPLCLVSPKIPVTFRTDSLTDYIIVPKGEKKAGSKLYEKVTIAELQKIAPFIQWLDYFGSAFIKIGQNISSSQEITILSTEYLQKLSKLITKYQSNPWGQKSVATQISYFAVSRKPYGESINRPATLTLEMLFLVFLSHRKPTRFPMKCIEGNRQHRTARLQWCREHHNWTEQGWACVLFSDESRFSLSSDCRRQLIWRESGTAYRPENIQEKDRYPTCSIMVWAGIMINGRTCLHVVANGTMTGQRYIDEVLLPHVRLFRGAVGDKFVFMDDNATCHRTLAVQDCLDSEGIQRLVWPVRSPHLNPIENVWDALGRQVAGRNNPPTNKNTLIHALTEEWDQLPQQLLDNVVQNGNRFNRCQVIYSQFGLAIHQNDHQERCKFVEWAQKEIAVLPDFHKRILFSDEAHFWLNGYVNKQNCRIWSEANPQVYIETPLHPEKLTVWCALWAGGILLQKR
ncbi:transposable element Tcb2 transposase [Trichonephila clavipes]|nr:transposable element Tcb2 transposase [Trichonephila clavipes]